MFYTIIEILMIFSGYHYIILYDIPNETLLQYYVLFQCLKFYGENNGSIFNIEYCLWLRFKSSLH